MFPVSHSLLVIPCRSSGCASSYDSPRFSRATAVRMKRPATFRASMSSGTCLRGVKTCAGSFESGVSCDVPVSPK